MKKSINKIAYVIQAFLCIVLVCIDQLTKIYARNSLNPANGGESKSLIKGVFSFTYLENRGSIWGILQGKIDLLLIVSVLLFVFLVYVYIRVPKEKKYLLLLFIDSVMIAGAIGNTIDRIFFGYVTDFIYFELVNFPIFNFADCCITVAAVTTIIVILTKYKDDSFDFLGFKKKKETEVSAEEASEDKKD